MVSQLRVMNWLLSMSIKPAPCIWAMSAPAAKALSLPVMTITPMSSRASKPSRAAPSASIRASLRAFIWRGRFSRIRATRPWVSLRMGGSSCTGGSCSVDIDFLLLDEGGQALVLVDQQLAELGVVEVGGLTAQIGIAGLDVGLAQQGAHLAPQPGQHLGRRAIGGPQAEPDVEVGAREALLGHGGHVWEEGRAAGADDAQQLDLVAADVGEGDARVADEIGLARQHVLQRGGSAPVGDVGDVGAGGHFEQLAGQVGCSAGARRGVG